MDEKQKSIEALKSYIQNIYLAEDLTAQESINNLEKSLIELVDHSSGEHLANGLLITEDGYFLTNHHCIEKFLDRDLTLIKDYQNRKYKILKICEKNEKEDLALVKAEMPREPSSKKYKLLNTNSIKEFYLWNFPINLKTRWKNKE